MTVYDCCMYYNENDLFEIRLNQHWDFVDYFVVVEAGETHTGLKKPLNFDHERFAPWASKIIYRSFDNFADAMAAHPELLDSYAVQDRGPNKAAQDWTRDHFQYNYLFKVLLDIGAQDNDVVYLACCDEIIKRSAFDACIKIIQESDTVPMIMFKYWLYAYKYNLLNKDCNESDSSGGLTLLKTFKQVLPATLRDQRACTHIINDAGWHFTFMDRGDGQMILDKQRAWAHSRDIEEGRAVKFDNESTEVALKRFFDDYQLRPWPLTFATHPAYIVNNQNKFKDFIFNE